VKQKEAQEVLEVLVYNFFVILIFLNKKILFFKTLNLMVDIDVKTLFVFSAVANIFIIALFVTYIKLYKVKSPIINIFILSRVLGIVFLIILS